MFLKLSRFLQFLIARVFLNTNKLPLIYFIMVRYAFCGERVHLPFRCKFCGNYFCIKHHFPENHDCKGLQLYKMQRKEGITYPPYPSRPLLIGTVLHDPLETVSYIKQALNLHYFAKAIAVYTLHTTLEWSYIFRLEYCTEIFKTWASKRAPQLL